MDPRTINEDPAGHEASFVETFIQEYTAGTPHGGVPLCLLRVVTVSEQRELTAIQVRCAQTRHRMIVWSVVRVMFHQVFRRVASCFCL